MAKTIESILAEHGEEFSGDVIVDEFLLAHSTTLKGNTLEARAQIFVRLPDDSEWECDKVIKMRLKRVKPE